MHYLKHSGGKQFACDQCSYSSHLKGNLTQHMLIHNKDKVNKCDQCSYSSHFKNNLKAHMLIHKKDKAFKCDYTKMMKQHKLRHSSGDLPLPIFDSNVETN